MREAVLCVATAAIALLSAACGHDPATGSAPTAGAAPGGVTPAPAMGPVGLAEALAAPTGARLIVAADFAGWSGGCTGGPPRTRSDWMLVDGAGRCLYVSGRLPDGIAAPPDTRSHGTRVTVAVERLTTGDGRPYLQRTP